MNQSNLKLLFNVIFIILMLIYFFTPFWGRKGKLWVEYSGELFGTVDNHLGFQMPSVYIHPDEKLVINYDLKVTEGLPGINIRTSFKFIPKSLYFDNLNPPDKGTLEFIPKESGLVSINVYGSSVRNKKTRYYYKFEGYIEWKVEKITN